jgi:excisionase family DNA binding protein
MDIPIPEFSREQIPRFPHEREIRSIDPALFKPIPPSLQAIWPILKAIYQRTEPGKPKKAPAPEPKPLAESPYMDFHEACAYLRLTERQLKDLCRDQRITHARIDYRTFRFKRSDLDTWFEAYKLQEEIGLRLK